MSLSAEKPPVDQRCSWLPIGPIWLVLFGWSMLRIPVPAVNEPYYLGKALHWWNPQWCAGDFFLDSSNPHLVFYATFGWLTTLFSLPIAAIICRAIGLLVLATGWQCLASALTGRRWAGLFAVPVLLMLQALGSLSGEWIVGGIEGKVPSYGFLFFALGRLLTGRFFQAGIAAGLAISFHPLVGLWGVLASIPATQYLLRIRKGLPGSLDQTSAEAFEVPGLRQAAVMFFLMGMTALPGLIPAFSMLGSADPKTEQMANQLQVGSRLAHHLDPMKFPKESYRYWGMMVVLWALLQAREIRSPRQRWWMAFVWTGILIVFAGIVIGWGPRPVWKMPYADFRIGLLKFYFFRMGDQLVAVALSLAAVQAAYRFVDQVEPKWRASLGMTACLSAISFGALTIPFPDSVPSRMKPAELADWIEASDWLKTNSAPTDLVHVTDRGWAVKWFSFRPEYVNFKDMPQDAQSIVQWNRRLWTIADWKNASFEDGVVTGDELRNLRQQTGIRYLICGRLGPIQQEPVFSNNSFRIYELPE